MKNINTYFVLKKAREIANDPALSVLSLKKALGEPLGVDIKRWLSDQSPQTLLCLDFTGIHAVTLSVAEETGPLLMQTVQQAPALEHRYPIFRLNIPEPAYTYSKAFTNFNLNALCITDHPIEDSTHTTIINQENSVVVILGQLSIQMKEILLLADDLFQKKQPFTSDNLTNLEFLRNVSPGARSKRLTELYSRRLLAYKENPSNSKERLFIPAWRLE